MFCQQRTWGMACVLSAAMSAAAGCKRADVKDYIPPDESARAALTAALDAWKAGQKAEAIKVGEISVNAEDDLWKQGKKLTAYEIVGPDKGDDANRRFRVRLTLAGEAAPKETVYVIFGKEPIWVMNEVNYGKASGM